MHIPPFLSKVFPRSNSPIGSRLKKVDFKDVKAENSALLIGDDKFNYANVAFATINTDPEPTEGIGGSIELVAREYSGPDGLRIIPHKYIVTSIIDNNSLKNFVDELVNSHEIDVKIMKIDNELFSKEFLRVPTI